MFIRLMEFVFLERELLEAWLLLLLVVDHPVNAPHVLPPTRSNRTRSSPFNTLKAITSI